MALILSPGQKQWPTTSVSLKPQVVQKMYEQGFAGALRDPEAAERFDAKWPLKASEIAHNYRFAGSAAGQLVIPFVHILSIFPNCLPGAAQGRGDCVSHSEKNKCLLTLCTDIVRGEPDEESGKVEGVPEVPKQGILEGVLSTEAIYWWRGHGGDGWSCDHSAEVSSEQSGLWLRQNYPEFDFDLTEYSSRLAGKWGRSSPPDEILQFGRKHLARQGARVDGPEVLRDLLYMGCGIGTCGGEGFSSDRNEHGVSRRRGSWAHAMAYIGFDDRAEIIQIYGEPLVLVLNSWGIWNGGPRDILNSAQYVPAHLKDAWAAKGIANPATGNIMIPEGSFWAKWSDVRRRSMYASSGVNGWPTKALPDFGATGII